MFKLSQKHKRLGTTQLENTFILDYLPTANELYLKVYIWGLYLCQTNDPSLGIDDIARELSVDVKKVEEAFRYWERRKLVKRLSDNPPTYEYFPLNEQSEKSQAEFLDEDYVSFAEDMYAIFEDKRNIRPNEIQTAYEWIEELNISKEIVILLLNHCKSTKGNNFSFKYAQGLAIELKEKNILGDESAAIKFFLTDKKSRDGAKKVLNRFGQHRTPSEDEIGLYQKWITEYKLKEKDILSACQETVKASSPSFAYLDKVLLRLKELSADGESIEHLITHQKKISEAIKKLLHMLGIKVPLSTVEPIYRKWRSVFSEENLLKYSSLIQLKEGNFEDLTELLSTLAALAPEKREEHFDKEKALFSFTRELMLRSGSKSKINTKDIEQINAWKQHFNDDIILYAAEQAKHASHKFKYIDRVLSDYKAKGISTIEQAKNTNIIAAKAGKHVVAQNYVQRVYTESQLEADALELLRRAEEIDES